MFCFHVCDCMRVFVCMHKYFSLCFLFCFVGWQFVELNEIRNAYKIVNKVFYCLKGPGASNSVSSFLFMDLSLVCHFHCRQSNCKIYIYVYINIFAK